MPIQNTGVPMPMVARNVITWSMNLPRRMALMIPKAMPMIVEITSVGRPMATVRGSRSCMMSSTGLWYWMDWPKSPRKMPLIQMKYCSSTGLLRLSSSRSASTSSWDASSPRDNLAGSPGRMCIRENANTDTRNTTTMDMSTRLMMNLPMRTSEMRYRQRQPENDPSYRAWPPAATDGRPCRKETGYCSIHAL